MTSTWRRTTAEIVMHDATWLYFIQGEDGGPIKIGLAVDPDKRLKALQTSSPSNLVIRRLVKVHREKAYKLERGLHKHFKDARVRGEWFEPVPELVRMARAVPPVDSGEPQILSG